ncbi:XRE family transcriptional regulator [Enterococcus raffinosus]|uniref:helix-turn-helix domain-containing protein n=1 Tax=Enterococcus raffinosus TaxID=71452 RepID=UPI001C109044|nr:XRE family transcriptional regulator [Enterococcus raffinosus]MBU5363395.1 XRE family transcriptional regulator [Enterococcus raffinosus]
MSMPFVGARLREARRFRQLSITQLGEKLGVSKQMVSKYEKGMAQPSAEVYQKIVAELNFPLGFFQEEDKFSFSDNGTFYRSRLSSTQSEKKPSELLKKYLGVIANYFEEYVDFPKLEDASFSEDPILAASELRKLWGLGTKPISNIMALMEEKGFLIGSINSHSEKVDAFGSYSSVNGNDYYCVLIDQDNNSFFRQQFSLAHEIAHWVLHSKSIDPQELGTEEYRQMEKEANLFASNFLLPAEEFVDDIKENVEDLEAYVALKNKWHVSGASMIYRAKSLDLLDSEQYLRIQKKMSYRGWRRAEPFDEIAKVSRPVAMKQAYELLVDAKIINPQTFRKELQLKYGVVLPTDVLAELLNVPISELQLQSNIVQIKSKFG